MHRRNLKISGEVPKVKIPFVVRGGKEGGVLGVPVDVVDVIVRVLEGSDEGVCFGGPELHAPVEGGGEDETREDGVLRGGVVDGEAGDGAVVAFVGDGFVIGVLALGGVEGAFVNGTVLGSVVVCIHISFREFRASDVDVSPLLLGLSDGIAKVPDIPNTQLSIVRDRDHRIGNMRAHNIHSVDWVLVPV